MSLRTPICLCYALLAPVLFARSNGEFCGTYRDNWREVLDHHRKAELRRAASPKTSRSASTRRDADIGNIAVMESDDSIFGRRNPFNLDKSQVTFTPSAGKYQYATLSGGFDQAAAGSGTALSGIGDDDTRRVDLPFAFPFYGVEYRELWVNSDGNVTFTAGDNASSSRSLGRVAAGPPRIAALFSDLDPTLPPASIRVTASAASFTVTWLRVPEYSDFNNGRPQTFQLRLTPDGKILLAWDGVNIADGVVGISPGDSIVHPLLASFLQNPSGSGEAMIAERFGDAQALDLVSAARRFYETHDDAYDYLAFFNTTGVQPGQGVLAFETTVRGFRRGIGDTATDSGREYGSPNRLQAVLNMGPVANFPLDPNSPHPSRGLTGDTGLTVFAHEIGHLFLAFSSIRDPNNAAARPMLGRQLFHWNFRFNSEASLLEGNRIRDDGPNANPRFVTTATVEGYSPLDQYLMGLRSAEEVPTTFLVENATTTLIDPRVGVGFNGTRRNITVADLIAVDGRRVPDYTVEQRRYRIAMIVIVPEGQSASADTLATLERYRAALETAFPRYTSNNAVMDPSIRRSVRLSVEPSAGTIASAALPVEVTISKPASTPLTIGLRTSNGLLDGPASITIPAGARSATASFRALQPGVELLRAEPLDNSGFMVTEARVSIASSSAGVNLMVLSGNRQIATPGQPLPSPIVLRVTDINDLPYPNLRIVASGGAVTPAAALTGPDGRVSFQWTPAGQPLNVIQFRIDGAASPVAEVFALGAPAFSPASVVNAASFRQGMVPGSIATIFGANLAQPQVTVDGARAQVFYADDRQINFAVPNLSQTGASATVQVQTSLGSVNATVALFAVQPGIFFDTASGRAAAIDRGSRTFEVYATGLGSASNITAQAGGRPAAVLFSGLAPGFVGLYQVNVRVDPAVAVGDQPLTITAGGVSSNEVKLPVAP
ncbi:MAG: hypothetical protein HYX27_11575 [Acidobacteria bacterium]|nr:hypothetical protein [Acidobacteriota bacterium]